MSIISAVFAWLTHMTSTKTMLHQASIQYYLQCWRRLSKVIWMASWGNPDIGVRLVVGSIMVLIGSIWAVTLVLMNA